VPRGRGSPGGRRGADEPRDQVGVILA
jgi:hypothetical protein